eukprot:365460-Chlamydomonas_euryale.AAC.10
MQHHLTTSHSSERDDLNVAIHPELPGQELSCMVAASTMRHAPLGALNRPTPQACGVGRLKS